jgi:hypothetical protein
MAYSVMDPNEANELPMNPPITVCVPMYNNSATIERCLRSVLDQEGVEFEIVVVDDDSSDESAAIATPTAGNALAARGFRPPSAALIRPSIPPRPAPPRMLDSNLNTPVRTFGVPGVGLPLKSSFWNHLTNRLTMSPGTCPQSTSGNDMKAVGSPA